MRPAVINMSMLPQSFLRFFAQKLDTSGSTWNMVLPGQNNALWEAFDPNLFAQTAPFIPDNETMTTRLAQTLQEADMILLLTDPLQNEENLQYFLSQLTQPVFIMPVSMLYPYVRQSESIGYDTALNEIVNQALSVADTADSMKYGKPRLFFLQLPKGASRHLTKDVALSTGGLELTDCGENARQSFQQRLTKHFQSGSTYALAAVDEAMDMTEINEQLSENMDVNINIVTVDSAQCLGPKLSAKDRLLMVQAAEKANEWVQSTPSYSGQVEWFHVTA
ncbi:hypothetical protein D7Z54_11990 [Salibacterium salarium]|uniref:Phosphofructokinase n=1 Tax=Salibacterium salarium TaxID=284579 RepID=A0A428N414_9BACI|nr:hypothetical protein [Salibacterium salarium]RSL33029.1 hypothetical protein D7Z54_11990 [Salibacterium salarium]